MLKKFIFASSLILTTSVVYADSVVDYYKDKIQISQGTIGNLLSENENQLVLYPYEPNYIIYSYTSQINKNAIQDYSWANNAHNDESKFQISLAFPILKNILGRGSLLGASYTQRSFWQMLNTSSSSPFRETNYEPQVFLGWDLNYPLFGFTLEELEVGFNHQSNGQPRSTSRSWNRLYGRILAMYQDFMVELKTWYRFPERLESDDNPDITKYLGYYRLKLGYKYNDHVFSAMTNYNWASGYGNAELGWSYPITKSLRFYTQLFSGYGESLIDYNYKQTRFGMGLMLNDLPYNSAKDDLRRRVGAVFVNEKLQTKYKGQYSDGGILGNLMGEDRQPLKFYAYEPNYLMHTFTSNINKNAIKNYDWAAHARKDETKFQLSLAIPIWVDLFGKNTLLATSYTQKSLWQSVNSAQSSPFRDTNYEPQLFVAKYLNHLLGFGGWEIKGVEIGLNHQSNGQPHGSSRSWNRVYGRIIAKNDHFIAELKPWVRIPEAKRKDNNPDITKYMGYYRARVGYQNNGHVISATGNYNWNTGYGGAEIGYSYPLSKSVRLYTQVFSGYGESLIDYNHKQTRFGIGIMLNDIF